MTVLIAVELKKLDVKDLEFILTRIEWRMTKYFPPEIALLRL